MNIGSVFDLPPRWDSLNRDGYEDGDHHEFGVNQTSLYRRFRSLSMCGSGWLCALSVFLCTPVSGGRERVFIGPGPAACVLDVSLEVWVRAGAHLGETAGGAASSRTLRGPRGSRRAGPHEPRAAQTPHCE